MSYSAGGKCPGYVKVHTGKSPTPVKCTVGTEREKQTQKFKFHSDSDLSADQSTLSRSRVVTRHYFV